MEATRKWSLRLGVVALLVCLVALLMTGCGPSQTPTESQDDQKSEESSSSDEAATGTHFLSKAVVTGEYSTTTVEYSYDDAGNITQIATDSDGHIGDTKTTINSDGQMTELNCTFNENVYNDRLYQEATTADNNGETTYTLPWEMSNYTGTEPANQAQYTGTTAYTYTDKGLAKYEETEGLADSGGIVTTIEFGDNGLPTTMNTAAAESKDPVVTYTFDTTINGTSGTVTAKLSTGDTHEFDLTLDEDGHVTKMADKDGKVTVELTYDAQIANPTELTKAMNQATAGDYIANIPLYYANDFIALSQSILLDQPCVDLNNASSDAAAATVQNYESASDKAVKILAEAGQ